MHVALNGRVMPFPVAGIRRIVITAGRGEDLITVDPGIPVRATVLGGPGSDRARVNAGDAVRGVETVLPE